MIKPLSVDAEFAADPVKWLTQKAKEHELQWLLAHADDGVIWGKMGEGRLAFSPSPAPELRVKTLQQVRLFGQAGELWLWRDEGGFAGRLLLDDDAGFLKEESYLLWGDHIERSASEFAVLIEGAQGYEHAVPIPLSTGQRAALTVRHYVDYDGQGQAYVSDSRLVGITAKETGDDSQS